MEVKNDELMEKSNVSFERKIEHVRYLHYNFSNDFHGIIDPRGRCLDDLKCEKKMNLLVVMYHELGGVFF
jgi:hypothetical protein